MKNNNINFDDEFEDTTVWLDETIEYKGKDYPLYKKSENSKIYWVDSYDREGPMLITFDKKRIYNLWKDYPYKMSDEEIKIFNKEEPYWTDFFKCRDKSSRS